VCACRESARWGRHNTDLRHGEPHHAAATHGMAPANHRRVAALPESCTPSRIAVCAQPSGSQPPAGGGRARAPRVHERSWHWLAAPADVSDRLLGLRQRSTRRSLMLAAKRGLAARCKCDRRVERCFKHDAPPRSLTPATTRRSVPTPAPSQSSQRTAMPLRGGRIHAADQYARPTKAACLCVERRLSSPRCFRPPPPFRRVHEPRDGSLGRR
jgi:hypothetical protein